MLDRLLQKCRGFLHIRPCIREKHRSGRVIRSAEIRGPKSKLVHVYSWLGGAWLPSSVCRSPVVATPRLFVTMARDVLVSIKQGQLRGRLAKDYLGNDYLSFQGIPYAKAPIGKLRFQPPQPPDPWTGVWDGTIEGPECPSAHLMFLYNVGKEDNCLNLNVYTKQLENEIEQPKKPVMVFIHGGAFMQGCNKTEFFGPEFLMTEDIVLVVINYRLNIFGFLALEDESLGVPGNNGLKDQVQALKWVKENIEKFGGDPDNVTIFGESAGSASVHYLTLSPLAEGLFHRSIMQSGCTLDVWAEGMRGVKEIAPHLGIKDNDEAKVLKKLENLPAKKIVNIAMKFQETMEGRQKRAFIPVIEKQHEGAFITQPPSEILKSGNYNKVPMIIGVNSNEGLLYIIARKSRRIKGPIVPRYEIPHMVGLDPESQEAYEVGEKIKNQYDLDEKDPNSQPVWNIKADHHFIYGSYKLLNHLVDTNDKPVFYYLFDFDGENNYYKKFSLSKRMMTFAMIALLKIISPEVMRNAYERMGDGLGFKKAEGCCHGDDLGYLFNSIYSKKTLPGTREEKTIKRLVKLWTSFARDGEPPKDVEWEPVKKEHRYCLKIGDELELIESPFKERVEFWDKIYENHSK